MSRNIPNSNNLYEDIRAEANSSDEDSKRHESVSVVVESVKPVKYRAAKGKKGPRGRVASPTRPYAVHTIDPADEKSCSFYRSSPKLWSSSRHINKAKVVESCPSSSSSDDSTRGRGVHVRVTLNPFQLPQPTQVPSQQETPQSSIARQEPAEVVVADVAQPVETRLEEHKPQHPPPPERERQKSVTAAHVKADNENDAKMVLPFANECDTFPLPQQCPDDAGTTPEEQVWCPGKPLRVVFVTWNMAGRPPNESQIASSCIHPNGHIVIVGTQENGPYLGSNRSQKQWEKIVSSVCLRGAYDKIGSEKLWASHVMVFARRRDVAGYISHVHVGKVACGFLGVGGNKGAVAVAFAVDLKHHGLASARPCSSAENTNTSARDYRSPGREGGERASTSAESPFSEELASMLHGSALLDPGSSEKKGAIMIPRPDDLSSTVDTRQPATATDSVTDPMLSSAGAPPYFTVLCVNGHFPAHQDAVVERNNSYSKIVRSLAVGSKGSFKKFPWQSVFAPSLSPMRNSSEQQSNSKVRDVTEEFDVTFFGGDLNYRINGTQKAIERIANAPAFRAVLSANDQLNTEKSNGRIFQGFCEGELRFRPTYKYTILKEEEQGAASSTYQAASAKKARMPAYCDRVLYRIRDQSRVTKVNLHTYTDVQTVTTSDHRPVVAIFDIVTNPVGWGSMTSLQS